MRSDIHQKKESGKNHLKTDILLKSYSLNNVSINDILIPRSEVFGIDLEDNITGITERLSRTSYTYLPVFHRDVTQITGVLNINCVAHMITDASLTKKTIIDLSSSPFFVPEETPLLSQLVSFHKRKKSTGIVVDEYGEILGIVTLEDIIEEIINEFVDNSNLTNSYIEPFAEGRYIVDGSVSIRELNKTLKWKLPCNGPKTLNGLVNEFLETLSKRKACLKIECYYLEILGIEDNRIGKILVWKNNSLLNKRL